MTRLLSNLIKSVYFNVDKSKKVVIDTNKIIEKMPEFKHQVKTPEGFEFVPGLNVINVEDIIEEQRAKVNDDVNSLVENARTEAEKILEKARIVSEQIRSDAYKEGLDNGYSDGKKQAAKEADRLEKEYTEKEMQLSAEYEQMLNELEPQFAELVSKLVENLTGIVVEDNKDVINYIIDRYIKNIPKSNHYKLHVSVGDSYSVGKAKEELQSAFGDGTIIDVIEDDKLSDNQCLIETKSHIIDCSLDVQLSNIKQEIRLLAMQR